MHKIYFGKRSIVICAPDDEALSDPNSVEFHLGDKLDIHALVRMTPSGPTAASARNSRRSMRPAAWYPTAAATTS